MAALSYFALIVLSALVIWLTWFVMYKCKTSPKTRKAVVWGLIGMVGLYIFMSVFFPGFPSS
jgi:hypothetical protein